MWKMELNRLLKSKYTFIIFVILLIGIISFLGFDGDKKQLIDTYNYDFSTDLNRSKLLEVISNYTGWMFMLKFLDSPEYTLLESIAFILWIGAFLTPTMVEHKNNGIGNMILSRETYMEYLKNVVVSQSIYIIIIVAISSMLQLLSACFIAGWRMPVYLVGDNVFNGGSIIFIILFQTVIYSLYLIMINIFSLLFSLIIKNRYVACIMPIFIFVIVPTIVGITLGNVFNTVAEDIIYFESTEPLLCVNRIIQNNYDISVILKEMYMYVVVGIAIYIMGRNIIKKEVRTYV